MLQESLQAKAGPDLQEASCQSPCRKPEVAKDLISTCHRPWYRGNQTRSVVINVIVFDKLLIGQNDCHNPSIVSVEAGRKDHTIQ